MTRCPYCQSGRIAVEPGSSLTYPCPDCDGTGWRYVPEDMDDFEPEEVLTPTTQRPPSPHADEIPHP